MTDHQALLNHVSGTRFDAIDMSISSAFTREDRLSRLAKTIADKRRASRNPGLLVVVGDRPVTRETRNPNFATQNPHRATKMFDAGYWRRSYDSDLLMR